MTQSELLPEKEIYREERIGLFATASNIYFCTQNEVVPWARFSGKPLALYKAVLGEIYSNHRNTGRVHFCPRLTSATLLSLVGRVAHLSPLHLRLGRPRVPTNGGSDEQRALVSLPCYSTPLKTHAFQERQRWQTLHKPGPQRPLGAQQPPTTRPGL